MFVYEVDGLLRAFRDSDSMFETSLTGPVLCSHHVNVRRRAAGWTDGSEIQTNAASERHVS